MDYKERLEEAKRLYETATPDQKYVLESLFPEIQESGDEKIRKWLIDTIKSVPNDSIEWDVIKKSDIIAWLDKQGEKKPIEVKEVDLEKEFDNYTKDIMACDVQFEPFTQLYNCAKHFFELGLKTQKGE